jgi:zinc protease
LSKLLCELSHELPLVHLGVVFRGGAVHERSDAHGLARITGRMLRRGAEGMSEREIEERIDGLGGDL